MKKLHVKKGDFVKIIAGNYKNKQGKIIQIFPKKNKATVENINYKYKHIKATEKNPKGGIVQKEAAIHISNIMVIDPLHNIPTKIGRKLNDKNKLQRFAKKKGNFI